MTRCMEYVGNATATGARRICSRKATFVATSPDATVFVCGHHVKEYDGEPRAWHVKKLGA